MKHHKTKCLVIIILTAAILTNIYLYNSTETKLTEQTHQLLTKDTQNKLQKINNYITTLTNKIQTLQNNKQIINAIKRNETPNIQTNYTNIILTSTTGEKIYSSIPTKHQPPQNKNTTITGPYLEGYGELYPKISITTPIYENQNLLGYITIIDTMKTIFEITKDTTNLQETGQSYIVNYNKLLLTPLRNYEFDIMTQEIKTANAEECIKHQKEIENENKLKTKSSESTIT
jgi:methyl-accepting chemotaxis protein